MKFKALLTGIFAIAALAQVGLVFATKTEVIVKAQNKADFAEVVATVDGEMKPGGRYGFIDKKEHEDVDHGLALMQSLFERYGTVDQMSPEAKIELFNHQEAVNAILTRRDNNRRVCESVAPVGSHIPRTICRTYGLIEQERRETRRTLDDLKAVKNSKGSN